MISSISLSTTSRRRPAATLSSAPAGRNSESTSHQLTAGDVISVRFRRRRRYTRDSKYSSRTRSSSPRPLMLLFIAIASFFFANKVAPVYSLSTAKNQWISNSLKYYNRVTRGAEHVQESPTYLKSAMENYFALEKLRQNKPQHAESIYRRLMTEFNPLNKHGELAEICDFSNLAVPTLLLGLLLQREERYEDARAVFDGFSHVLDEAGPNHECCCAARVLQAHALFEMKQDNPVRAAELIIRAVRMDRNLRPVLQWKLFRNALVEYAATNKARLQQQRQQSRIGFAAP